MVSDMLSQEEIDALLKGGPSNEPSIEFYEDDNSDKYEGLLTEIEMDALGEIGNISMGTAATTLSTLLNRKVNITTPKVTITTADELSDEYILPFVAIDVSYKSGLEGANVLILDRDDVKIITDLMMGKDSFDISRDLTEMDLSAVSEAMNQMMGSASTSLSEMFMKKIDIEPPRALEITFSEGQDQIKLLSTMDPIIKISFKMVIGDHIDSNIMQLIPIEFGKEIVSKLMGTSNNDDEVQESQQTKEHIVETTKPHISSQLNSDNIHNISQTYVKPVARTESINYTNTDKKEEERVLVKKPEFQNFDILPNLVYNEPIDLVGDIPVEITVELGRTNKKISEILEFGQGTVVELDKLVGESLNIYANGKYIAKGEVVVIDDNFGVRVTEIDNTHKKII